ncbi:PilZ domain-containing protein [Kordiimonas marina]|uniref:PilZ domain-containing protein n=1 Tax=Kordiimonas marina TaxID=2872312 RepID=UPI001FF35E13|nr:PilZ domain-containing protein [Kordiimonas marina]MCJ9428207.1 PilZ domain-containing protein [Kordiimonas marina]
MTTMEKRRDNRLPVLWHGTLTTEDDRQFPCEVRDVSTAGTLITCETDLSIGDELILTIDGLGEFATEVKWQGSAQLGLAIIAGPDLMLKKFAEGSGAALSEKPVAPAEDPLGLQ